MQELTYGVARWSYRIEALLQPLQKKPLRNKDTDIKILLWMAVYEILYMRTPDYAVVDSYAGLTSRLRKRWAKGFLNATLRAFLRQQDSLVEKVDSVDEKRHSLPGWIYRAISDDWPAQSESILTAGNARAFLVLRVNSTKISRDDYQAVLADQSLASRPTILGELSLVLETNSRVTALPGFIQGQFSVQDSAAQLAASLLDPQPQERVLDACAAPGGKTGHLLELQPGLALTAIDNDPRRLARIEENLQRLGHSAEILCADAAQTDQWWDKRLFDAILLDAPCSALGVMRRHPDIRLLRQQSDIKALALLQNELLRGLWKTLKPGGRLIYATCSVLKKENEQAIKKFLECAEDAKERVINADWGHRCLHGRQILPGQYDSDGFYYAILEKNQT